MDGMTDHGGGGHDMGGMNMSMSPPGSPAMPHKHKMMMHMSFYWGHEAEIIFPGWPGSSAGMYVLSLFVVFILAFLVEWLSRSHFVKAGSNEIVSGVLRTFLHAVRMTLAYLVMLAVMSFNTGVFLVVILGHALGFLVFGTRIFGSGRNEPEDGRDKGSDLPPLIC